MTSSSSDTVNTRIIDHLVHLTHPGSVEQASEDFRRLGFTVIPGGIHADGLTANALVLSHDPQLLQDGSYLELISFIHHASHYPNGSDDRTKRENHRWARRSPGWIDYAFLGTGSRERSIANTINSRAVRHKVEMAYLPEVDGGRRRPDGEVLKWLISSSQNLDTTGILPFFCGDVTPRELRCILNLIQVPRQPESHRQHPSTVEGIAYVEVVTSPAEFARTQQQLAVVIGREPDSPTDDTSVWFLDTPSGLSEAPRPKLILTKPLSESHLAYSSSSLEGRSGIFEVGFFVRKIIEEDGPMKTPYGSIRFICR